MGHGYGKPYFTYPEHEMFDASLEGCSFGQNVNTSRIVRLNLTSASLYGRSHPYPKGNLHGEQVYGFTGHIDSLDQT